MKLQVSIDLLSLEQAMNLLREIAPFVDIIEAGTLLIKQEGMRAIATFKHSFPDKLITANMKTVDAGGLEADMAFRAGADFTTILALSSDGAIAGALSSARKYDKSIIADMMLVQGLEQRARTLEAFGIQYLSLSCCLDDQSRCLTSETIDRLTTLSQSTSAALVATGGVNQRVIQQLKALGVEIAIVGAILYASSTPKEIVKQIRQAMNGETMEDNKL